MFKILLALLAMIPAMPETHPKSSKHINIAISCNIPQHRNPPTNKLTTPNDLPKSTSKGPRAGRGANRHPAGEQKPVAFSLNKLGALCFVGMLPKRGQKVPSSLPLVFFRLETDLPQKPQLYPPHTPS